MARDGPGVAFTTRLQRESKLRAAGSIPFASGAPPSGAAEAADKKRSTNCRQTFHTIRNDNLRVSPAERQFAVGLARRLWRSVG
jgi:hypothetical protein